MTFGLPIAAKTMLLAAGAAAALVVGAYILKMRRRRYEVPFSALWQRVLQERQSTSLWRRLKRLLSLLLQLAILGLLLLATTAPEVGTAPEEAKHVVLIVDGSASMKATDGKASNGKAGDGRATGGRAGDGQASAGRTTRMAVALERARDLVRGLGDGDSAMILRMDGRATPLTRFERDKAVLLEALDGFRATDTPADLRAALAAAADALRDREHPMIVLIGDGVYEPAVLEAAVWEPLAPTDDFASRRLSSIDLSGVDVRFAGVGKSGDNLGIVAFNVRRYIANRQSYEVFIEVQNFSDKPTGAELTLYNGDDAIDVQTFALEPGKKLRRSVPNLGGGDSVRLRAAVRPVPTANGQVIADVFPLDDVAYALLPASKSQTVLMVSAGNHFLDTGLGVFDNIRTERMTPEEYDAAIREHSLATFDAVVFDRYAPERLPDSGHLLYFAPAGEHSPFPIERELEAPRITEVREAHPVMKWLQLGDVNFVKSSVYTIDAAAGETALAKSIRAPLIAARYAPDGRKTVAIGFSLDQTDLVLRVAFPLLLANALDWFAGEDSDLVTTYTTGHRFRVALDAPGATEASVREPSGRVSKAPVSDRQASFFGTEVGIYTLTAGDGERRARVVLAANLSDPAESNLRPPEQLRLGERVLSAPPAFAATRGPDLWKYLVLAVILLLGLEWFTYNRRITV